jgi:O-succinylbenzoic acid--CoA ligase
LEIPEIRQAIVVAISDSEFGQRPVAFLDSDEIEVERIAEFLGQRLAKYKIPDRFLPWPKKEVGTGIKPSRKRLAELGECENKAGRNKRRGER